VATRGPRFWLVWSWRDLRRRWPLIVAIGLLLAGGTGLAAGLGSMRDWRVESNDASFAALNVHDLRISVEEGSFVPEGSLARAVRSIPDADRVTAVSERLILPTQIDASASAEETVITPGQLIGVETGENRSVDGVDATGPEVDAIAIERGEGFSARDPGAGGILEARYAEENGIEPPALVELPGGNRVHVSGIGTSPETFIVLGPGGQFSGERNFGVLFVALETAQRLTGRTDSVNDLTLALRPETDRAEVVGQLEREIGAELPGIGFTVSTTEDLDSHRILYEDAENDQQLFNVFAFLILAGAGFAAFNLISRTIESQRREIGVGMALGVDPSRLAIRPLMMGAQIAVIGTVLGIGVGILVNEWLRGLLADQLPLPVLETDFRPGTFAQRAAIGFAIPLLAAAWPVRRGLRVAPIDAIRAGFRASRGGGLAPALARIRLPGRSLAQMPPRNVLRSPRRTLLTVLASGAVIAVAVSMSGMLDSFGATVERNATETLRVAPERLSISLDRFYPVDAPEVEALTGSREVSRFDRTLSLPGRLRSSADDIEVAVGTLPEASPVWMPRTAEGDLPSADDEVLISQSAADALDAVPGDRVLLEHPRRSGRDRFSTVETSVRVSGIHPDPFRFPVYMDATAADRFGLAGRTNSVAVLPAPGIGESEAKRALIAIPGAASIEAASTPSETLDEGLEEFAAIIRVVVAIAVLLVLLIAFNSTAINADERAREHATMVAYGVPLGRVLRLTILESLILGVLATVIGIALGLLILSWVVNVSLAAVLPELGVVVSLSVESVLLAAVAGAGAMAAAPLLTARRLWKMDVPSTLRVVE
jgi:putative ABC transport system permease protein